MRRSARVASLAILLALVPALSPNIAQSDPVISSSASYDFGAAAFRALFGETTDANAALAASYGDLSSESPMREFAITTVPQKIPDVAFAPGLSSTITFAQERPAHRGSASVGIQHGRLRRPRLCAECDPVRSGGLLRAGSFDCDRRAAASRRRRAAGSRSAERIIAVACKRSRSGEFVRQLRVLAKTRESPHGRVRTELRGRTRSRCISDGCSSTARSAGLRRKPRRIPIRTTVTTPARTSTYGPARTACNVDVSSSYEHLMRDDTISYSSALPVASKWEIGGDAVPALPS